MSTIEIRLLGSFSVTRDGQPVGSIHGKRCRDLLSYLSLYRDESHARSYVAELLWGHLDTERARHCFNTALWRLQKALGNGEDVGWRWLRHDAHGIELTPAANVHLDVADFEQRCTWAEQLESTDADQAAIFWHQALGLYRGDLLADCYEDWCLVDRERLQRLYIKAARRLMRYHAIRREYDEAIDAARRILTCDPLHEEMHRDLIQLYIDACQPTAALEQYRACEHVLQRELGTPPMPETQALLQRIIRLRGQGPPCSVLDTRIPYDEPLLPSKRPVNPTNPGGDQSSVLVHQACQHLREAVQLLEAVADRLGTTLSSPGSAGASTSAAEIRQVTALISDVARAVTSEPVAAVGSSG